MWVLPFLKRERVQSHIERGGRRWLGRSNSRGKISRVSSYCHLTRASSRLMPRGKLERSRNCQRRSQASRSVRCSKSLGVEQNSRTNNLTSLRPRCGGVEKCAPHALARLDMRMSRKWLYIRARRESMVWPT